MQRQVFAGLVLVSLGDFSSELFETDPDLNPLYWLFYLVVGTSLHMLPTRAMWSMLFIASVMACGLLLFAGISAMPHINFSKYATEIAPDKFH